jgi:hypothetical protein
MSWEKLATECAAKLREQGVEIERLRGALRQCHQRSQPPRPDDIFKDLASALADIHALAKKALAGVTHEQKEVERLNRMLRDTGYGQGQIDAYVAQCEDIDRLREALSRCLDLMHNGGTWSLDEQERFAALAEDKP